MNSLIFLKILNVISDIKIYVLRVFATEFNLLSHADYIVDSLGEILSISDSGVKKYQNLKILICFTKTCNF